MTNIGAVLAPLSDQVEMFNFGKEPTLIRRPSLWRDISTCFIVLEMSHLNEVDNGPMVDHDSHGIHLHGIFLKQSCGGKIRCIYFGILRKL